MITSKLDHITNQAHSIFFLAAIIQKEREFGDICTFVHVMVNLTLNILSSISSVVNQPKHALYVHLVNKIDQTEFWPPCIGNQLPSSYQPMCFLELGVERVLVPGQKIPNFHYSPVCFQCKSLPAVILGPLDHFMQ